MSNRFRLVMLALMICGILQGSTALAQGTPSVEPVSASVLLLPEAAAFGPGWTQSSIFPADQWCWATSMPLNVFRDGAIAAYGGPNGARVVVAVLLLTEDRVAVRRGWESATQLFNNYVYQLTYDYYATEEWDALDPPKGCAEARRAEGVALSDAYTTGVTLCAADPDLIVVAVAAGLVNDRSGYDASDWIATMVIMG